MKRWSIPESDELYNVSRWGKGYFTIGNNGHILATPKRDSNASIDIFELVEDLYERGITTPVLIRFDEMLGRRLYDVASEFAKAIEKYEYKGGYRPVVPIKVNQQKHVVEKLIQQGAEYHVGLEAGSKAELLAAIAMISDPQSTIICNGYKDLEYLETALLSCKLGLNTIVIVDRFDEIHSLIRLKRERGLTGPIGVRVKLSAKGAGRWAESGGESSKFGLSPVEITKAVELLRAEGMLENLKALHFHIGSQITAIRAIKNAIKEAGRVFVDLYKMGAPMSFLDVGGGLAIDYDGSNTNFSASMNYSVEEYAADIVSEVGALCSEHEVPHPIIISESGRALMAHHSVLVFDVLGVNEHSATTTDLPEAEDNEHELIGELRRIHSILNRKNVQECYNDLVDIRDQMLSLFILGYVSLTERARGDELFWHAARRIDALVSDMDYVPEEVARMRSQLYDTYYCNFSVFQSLPDAWAIDSLFPIMPIHRLEEEPTRQAILADLTCDSDGKLNRFIDLHDVKSRLPLHTLNGGAYYLAAFLVGAYQETLGDLHNLFGDTNIVHVTLDNSGNVRIEHTVEGDTVSDVLEYVEYDPKELISRVRNATEMSVRAGRMTQQDVKQFMKRYTTGLSGYTYLEGEDELV